MFRLCGERTTTDMVGAYQPFGDGGYRLRENFYGDADTLQGRFSIVTNELGLRCSQSRKPAPKPLRPIDILVIGDSQAFGAALNFEDTVVGQLAGRAAEKGWRLENAAVGGHFLENQFELVRWLYDSGERPRHIVLFLSPYLISTAGTYNRARVEPDGRLYDKDQKRRSVTSWLKRHTVLYAKLRNVINSVYRLPADDLAPLAIRTFITKNEAAYEQKTRRFLSDAADWAAARGISLSLVYTPWALEMAFDTVLKAATTGDLSVNVPYEASHRAAMALHLPYHDLRPVLAARVAAQRPLKVPGDEHYDADTSAACAELLWNALAAEVAADRPVMLSRSGSDHTVGYR